MNDNTLDGNLGDGMHLTYHPSITEWKHGDVRERIVIPGGEVTDYSSIPDKGILGWIAEKRGFIKSKPYFTRSGDIHDELCTAIKYWGGFLPDGWYQYFNPETNEWENIIGYKWTIPAANAIWERVSIEDGCPPDVAHEGRWWLDHFCWLHIKFT